MVNSDIPHPNNERHDPTQPIARKLTGTKRDPTTGADGDAAAQEAIRAAKADDKWTTRQPAQVTVQDEKDAQRDPGKVPPPGDLGPGEGPSS